MENLITMARARGSEAEFVVGDMFALPFRDGEFDVVTSFNAIWAGCDGAIAALGASSNRLIATALGAAAGMVARFVASRVFLIVVATNRDTSLR